MVNKTILTGVITRDEEGTHYNFHMPKEVGDELKKRYGVIFDQALDSLAHNMYIDSKMFFQFFTEEELSGIESLAAMEIQIQEIREEEDGPVITFSQEISVAEKLKKTGPFDEDAWDRLLKVYAGWIQTELNDFVEDMYFAESVSIGGHNVLS